MQGLIPTGKYIHSIAHIISSFLLDISHIIFCLLDMVPKVVETTLGQLAADGQVLKDFKIVGNIKSTTVVLRYCEQDMLQVSAHIRTSPLVNHKSPARQSRDMDRRHELESRARGDYLGTTYHTQPQFGVNCENNNMGDMMYSQQWSLGEGTGVNLHSTGSIHEWPLHANGDQLTTGTKEQEVFPPSYMHLTDYYEQNTSDLNFKPKKYVDVSVQHEEDLTCNASTHSGNVKCFSDCGVQTDGSLQRENHSVAIQCQSDTEVTIKSRTVGVSCRKYPSLKSRSCQATQVTKTQGVNAVTMHHDNMSQTSIHGAVKPVKPSGIDVSVMCWQSPGGVNRYCQTYHAKSVCRGTNTKSKINENSSTDTCDLTITVASSCQTNILDPVMELLNIGEPQCSSTVCSVAEECHSPEGLSWGDLTSTELMGELPIVTTNSDPEYIVPDSGVGISSSTSKDSDEQTLHGILSALGVPISTRTDYASLVHDENRNKEIHHWIECKNSYDFEGTEKVTTTYYCVFDDFIIPVTVSETDSPYVGRYIKLYDNYEEHLYCSDKARFVVVSHMDDVSHRQARKAVLDDLDNVISSVQALHRLVPWSLF
jgi:hypothetical protein